MNINHAEKINLQENILFSAMKVVFLELRKCGIQKYFIYKHENGFAKQIIVMPMHFAHNISFDCKPKNYFYILI